jgi:hypothetical protein
VLGVAELRHIDSKVRHAIQLTEEHGGYIDPQALELSRTQPAKARLRLGTDQHIELPEWQETAAGVSRLRIKPLLITALDITAVKRVSSKHV